MSGRLIGLSSMATRRILADLARDYEARKGTHVDIRSMGGVEAAKLVRGGEATDIVVLAAESHGDPGGRRPSRERRVKDLARSEIGIAVRAGLPLPSVETEQGVKQGVLEAGRICYSTGPSGDHLRALCEKWGFADFVLESRACRAAGRRQLRVGGEGRRRSWLSAIERAHRPSRASRSSVPCRQRFRP